MPRADDELLKVTLNLYLADVTFLEAHFGRGWSTEARACIHDWVRRLKEPEDAE